MTTELGNYVLNPYSRTIKRIAFNNPPSNYLTMDAAIYYPPGTGYLRHVYINGIRYNGVIYLFDVNISKYNISWNKNPKNSSNQISARNLN